LLAPFGQIDSSPARKCGGASLGVPITKRFAILLASRLDLPAASLAPADDHAASRAPDARLTRARQAIRIAFDCECGSFRWRCRHQHLYFP